MENILLVCTGNTCRSSMAEGILRQILMQNKIYDKRVKSAGTSVFFCECANEKAVIVMEELGIDISEHRSQNISELSVQEADLILTMTYSHKDRIIHSYPESIGKVFTLKEYQGDLEGNKENITNPDNLFEISKWDISDPYGRSLGEYRKTALEIKAVLETIVKLKGI